MAVDTVLWFLLAGMIAFIGCGCIYTAGRNEPAKLPDDPFDYNVERAA
jgi:hypothetical protein